MIFTIPKALYFFSYEGTPMIRYRSIRKERLAGEMFSEDLGDGGS